MTSSKFISTAGGSTRILVLHPVLRDKGSASGRSAQAALDEAVALARSINLEVVWSGIVNMARFQPNTLVGSGTVESLSERVASEKATLIMVNHHLTPVQQRNLEKACKAKVIDRTGLILEIFGQRAQTREGQLQVELAALTYQRSRLVRSWTHLERQRGGFGFLGGPGESQLEIDRRLIDERLVRLKKDLEEVRRTRTLQRKARSRVPYPIVALVGYTNAGKSTLFNRLSGAHVVAKDQLFATLDPTLRAVDLDRGRKVILSDTVGFISDLPTQLVAAFRATLEEVQGADVILHVRDVAHPDTEAQDKDVHTVLAELGINAENDPRMVEVLNKIDLLSGEARVALSPRLREGKALALSALTGEGIPALLEKIRITLDRHRLTVDVQVPLQDGAALAWLYDHGQVLSRRDKGQTAFINVALDEADLARFQHRQKEQKA